MFRRSNSVKLFSVFGIRVGVDLSWFVVLFLLIYLLSAPFRDTLHSSDAVAYLTTVISVLLLFVSLIVHEFGHALVARRQGIGVKQIDLYLFGGLTQMSRDAATPGEEFKVSAAGPLATLGVILVCLAIDLAIVGPHRLTHAIALDQDIHDHAGAAVAELAAADERPAAGVQPDAGLPARRRPHRPLDHLAGDRLQAHRHDHLGADGPGPVAGAGRRSACGCCSTTGPSPGCGRSRWRS